MFRLHVHRGLHTLPAQTGVVVRGWSWLALADLVGIFVAVFVMQWRVDDIQDVTKANAFSITLVATSLLVWLIGYISQRELPGRFDGRFYTLITPLVAASMALVVLASMRMFYSGTSLLIFVVVWTVWMGLGRYIHTRKAPVLQLLCPTGSGIVEDLNDLKHVKVTQLQNPPRTLQDWDAVIVDPRLNYNQEWVNWLTHASLVGVPTISAPLVVEKLSGMIPTNMLEGAWADEVFKVYTPYRHFKRFFDVAAVLLSLPILLPTALMVALVVWADGGRPILFKQWRIGKEGKPFLIWKFRTMRRDSERAGAQFATKDDARITRTGMFLRKYRLDELPQFWNVLKGDMSIIGPRPEQDKFAREFAQTIPLYSLRHSVLPGITGWAQVRHGYAANVDETHQKLRHDLYYVKNLSLLLDLEVVVLTIRTIFTGFGSR